MAPKSIIPNVELGAKSPFNKKLTVLLVLVALGAVGAAAYLGGAATADIEEVKKSEEPAFTEGTARNIQLEFDAPIPKAASSTDLATEITQANRGDAQTNPLPSGATMPAPGGQYTGTSGAGGVNNTKEDLEAQAAISAISVPYENETPSYPGQIGPIEKTAEQKIAEMFPNMPERMTEQDALNRAIAMSASAQAAMPGSVPDQNSSSALASKTKRFVSETDQQNKVIKVSRMNAAAGKWVITAGKTIPAITKRAQNSDLPCAVEAITSVDVYDSYTSTKKLIPKGSELIGVCSNDVAIGQKRILSLFSRLILPTGEWFDLSGGVGMDRTGATGLKGDVDNHFFQMFASAFLIAFTADRVENQKKGTTSNNVYMSNSAGAKTAAGQVLVDTSQFMLNRNRNVQPTIDVEAGTRINIQVKHDMVFD